MNIQNDYSYNNVSMQGRPPKKPGKGTWDKIKKKFEQKVLDNLPEKTFKEDENKLNKYDKYGSFIARPDVNRFIMGATAIATQPAIDYYNHRVDEETRTVSRNRTIAKIIAGTSVGILVRGSCYRLVNKMTDLNGVSKHSKALLPKDYINTFKNYPNKLANYKSALSTIMALGIMVFTNFLIDAPLTSYLTNKFNEKSANKKTKKEVLYG